MTILKLSLNERIKNNYVYLPREFIDANHIEGTGIIKGKKISSDDNYFFGWIGGVSNKESVIEISYLLGKNLKLNSGDYLKIYIEQNSNIIESIELIPASNHDYKIIESNASFFEENLLNQISVVYNGLTFPFIFFNNSLATLNVQLEEKNKPFFLSQECEVKVAYVPPSIENESLINTCTMIDKFVTFNYSTDNAFVNLENSVSIKVSRNFLQENFKFNENVDYEIKKYICNISLSNHPYFSLKKLIYTRLCDKATISKYYSTIYNNKSESEEIDYLIENNFLSKFPNRSNFWVNIIIDDLETSMEMNDRIVLEQFIKLNTVLLDYDKINLTLTKLDENIENSIFNNQNYFDFIFNNLSIEYYCHTHSSNDFGEMIRGEIINFINRQSSVIFNIDFLYLLQFTDDVVILKFNFENKTIKDYVDLLTKMKINLNKLLSDSVRSHPQPFILLNKKFVNFIEKLKFKKNAELGIIYNYNINNKMHRNIFSHFDNSNYNCNTNITLKEKNLELIENDLKENKITKKINDYFKNKSENSTALIFFPKEYYVKLFIYRLYREIIIKYSNRIQYCYVNLNLFNLNNLIDISVFKEYLKNLLKFHTYNKHRIIFIFEGLENFKKTDSSLQNNSLTTEINNLVSYIFTKFINICNKLNKKSTIGNLFYSLFLISGGIIDNISIEYFFRNTLFDLIKINTIHKHKLKEILDLFIYEFVEDLKEDDNYLEECSDFCRNYVMVDFVRIYNKFSSLRNKISSENFLQLLSDYTPVSISEEKIIKLSNDFSSIGGLDKIKEEIHDTIILSLKASEMFGNKIPIKMSSGILLIGPPGCGKTLLASSLQKQFKINFYSIKGPEILNKYIGASEAAIREIFENAKKTLPCIIFFDEFDSLAPKRGSGSSGVTDRIVNQLLTYLDGIESREGIFVIGASSRPDLIDPAILRPGRLDKIILCDFPNKNERFKILNLFLAKASSLNLSENIYSVLDTISQKTEFYTGADLQALIYDSFLKAVKRNINKGLNSAPIISEEDLFNSLNSSKKSISVKEINFFNSIKIKFNSRTKINDKFTIDKDEQMITELSENQLKMTLY